MPVQTREFAAEIQDLPPELRAKYRVLSCALRDGTLNAMSPLMTIDAARVWASDRLVAAGIVAAAREAAWLLEHVLALPAGTVQQHGDTALTREQETALRELVARRAAHYPLQYLLGHMEFAGARLRVTPEALIPRPETEDLVAEVLTLVTDRSAALRCADLGTGSGCIPIALALHRRARNGGRAISVTPPYGSPHATPRTTTARIALHFVWVTFLRRLRRKPGSI